MLREEKNFIWKRNPKRFTTLVEEEEKSIREGNIHCNSSYTLKSILEDESVHLTVQEVVYTTACTARAGFPLGYT